MMLAKSWSNQKHTIIYIYICSYYVCALLDRRVTLVIKKVLGIMEY